MITSLHLRFNHLSPTQLRKGIQESMKYSMEYFWSTFGALLEYFWGTFGVRLEYFLENFGVLLEYFWALLEYFTSSWHDLVNNA